MATRNYTAVQVSATCLNCAQPFTYTHKTGTRRAHCSSKCRIRHKAVRAAMRHSDLPECRAEGCCVRATRVGHGLCEAHYYQLRRTGRIGLRPPPKHQYHASGYLMVRAQNHPLAQSGEWMYEHRKIAYEKHGGVCPDCYWCGAALVWRTAVIDHLNESKQDNRPENLLVACNRCNRARGAMLPFIAAMRADAFVVMVDAMRAYRAKQDE